MSSILLQIACLCLASVVVVQGQFTYQRRVRPDPRLHHKRCSWSPSYTLWSNWSPCTAVHVNAIQAPCGPGRTIRYRQRDMALSTRRSSHSSSYYYDTRHCQPKCFGKEMFQTKSCTIPGHLSCYTTGLFATCAFEGADHPACSLFVSTTTLYNLVIVPSVDGSGGNVLSVTGGSGTQPFAYYALGDVFQPTLTYKYCLTYKARIDVGTLLYVAKLKLPPGVTANQAAFICAEAIAEGSRIQGRGSCENDAILECMYGSPKTSYKMDTFSLEITTDEAFVVGFVIVPQLTSDGTVFTGAELDDVGMAEGPC